MIVNEQKPIKFKNECGCKVQEEYLARAILWFAQGRNVARLKKIFLYGEYPAVSVYEQKIHIHRLCWMFGHNRELDRAEYIHHIDDNKLNAYTDNLRLESASIHQGNIHRGRKQSPEHIFKRINATTITRYGHPIYENKELLEVKC